MGIRDALKSSRVISRARWNLGHLMGLDGLASLLPLLGLWCALGAAWWALNRQAGRLKPP